MDLIQVHLGGLLTDENLLQLFRILFSGFSIAPIFLFLYITVCHFGLVDFSDNFLSFLFCYGSCL